jgi:hypothetical protein
LVKPLRYIESLDANFIENYDFDFLMPTVLNC